MKVMLFTPEELEQTWVKQEGQLIDLRSPKAFREGHIPGAKNVPEKQLNVFLHRQSRRGFFILYCQRGITSLQIGRKLAAEGYQIGALAGGMNAYEKWKSGIRRQKSEKSQTNFVHSRQDAFAEAAADKNNRKNAIDSRKRNLYD